MGPFFLQLLCHRSNSFAYIIRITTPLHMYMYESPVSQLLYKYDAQEEHYTSQYPSMVGDLPGFKVSEARSFHI